MSEYEYLKLCIHICFYISTNIKVIKNTKTFTLPILRSSSLDFYGRYLTMPIENAPYVNRIGATFPCLNDLHYHIDNMQLCTYKSASVCVIEKVPYKLMGKINLLAYKK